MQLLDVDQERQHVEDRDTDNEQGKDWALKRDLFRSLAGRLRRMRLVKFLPSDAADLLRAAPNLESLHLVMSSLDEASDLRDVLAVAPNLQHFVFEVDEAGELPQDWPVAWQGQLASLTLIDVSPTPSMYLFIDLFAPSLRSLVLDFTHTNSPPTPLPRPFQSTFPRLTRLRLSHVGSPSPPRSFKASPLPISTLPQCHHWRTWTSSARGEGRDPPTPTPWSKRSKSSLRLSVTSVALRMRNTTSLATSVAVSKQRWRLARLGVGHGHVYQAEVPRGGQRDRQPSRVAPR